jgi:hypothetical protein
MVAEMHSAWSIIRVFAKIRRNRKNEIAQDNKG